MLPVRTFPLSICNKLVTITFELIVNPVALELLVYKLSKVLVAPPPRVCAMAAPKVTIPSPGVNVPLLFQLPNKVNSPVLVMVKLVPLFIVRLRHTAPGALITGMFTAVFIITALVVAVGTPPHQLLASNQSLLVTPIHDPAVVTCTTNPPGPVAFAAHGLVVPSALK